MRAALVASASLIVLALASPVAAQTSIVPDTAAGLTVGTAISRAGAVTTIAGGTQAGGNLFHSFNSFSLGVGETAAWTATNPTSVANVINRVTGGGLSTISGTLDSTALPNADFYFINPAGILFSTGARLAVPNAAHFSTGAGGLRFADGSTFAALLPAGTSFSSTAPESFGFLGQENGLVIDGVGFDFIPVGTSLFLAGRNVGVNASNLTPLTFDVVATGGQARSVSLADPLGGAVPGGIVLLLESNIFATASRTGGQAIRIGADNLAVAGGFLTSNALQSGDAGDVTIRARAVDITGFIGAGAAETAPGNAGTVSITASVVRVGDFGTVSSLTLGRGAAGSVLITADTLLVETGGSIASDTLTASATGRGGTVQIKVGSLIVRDGGAISSSTNGPGDAGSVRVTANSILLDTNGSINSVALGSGNGGIVQIDTGSLEMRNQGGIASLSSSTGNAGNIQIVAGLMTMSSLANIFSTSSVGGNAGNVSISATSFTLNGGVISSDTQGLGRAGIVSISAPDFVVRDGVISSESRGPGAAGDVNLTAARLNVSNDSLISSSTSGAGAGGQVSIAADQAQIDFSEIRSQANAGSTGAAGTLLLTFGRLTATNQTVISSSTFGSGAAGLVSIVASDIALDNAAIVSRTLGSGRGGQVQIRTGGLSVDNGAGISSSTTSSGNAGGVAVTATRVTLDHGGTIESGAAVGSTGNGGIVSITADTLALRNAASLVSSTLATGNAGELQVTAGQISIESGSLLASRARGPARGSAGAIQVRGQTLQLLSGGQIETSSQNVNKAGDIQITVAGPVTIDGVDSRIASENLSPGGGAAGGILIVGAPIRLSEGGSISTNSVAGAAGDITLRLPSDSTLTLEGRNAPGVITTSSGPGTGGRITISNPLAVISNGGAILALGQAQGANVQIQSDFFIRSSDRLNLLSVDGDLVLDSQVSDVSAGVAIPDVSFLDASGVLRGQCPAARSGGITSQLSLRAFGPYALDAPRPPGPLSALRLDAVARLGGCL